MNTKNFIDGLYVTKAVCFDNNLDKIILTCERKDNNKDNKYYILCETTEDANGLIDLSWHSIKTLACNDIIKIISKICIHAISKENINEELLSTNSDYLGLADMNCSKYFQIYDVFTEKEYRNKGLTKKFMQYVLDDILNQENNDICIYTQADISCEEHPYSAANDEEKKNKILDGTIKFYEKCGFIEVGKMSDFENRSGIYLYFISDCVSKDIIKFYRDLYSNKNKAYNELHDKYINLVIKEGE